MHPLHVLNFIIVVTSLVLEIVLGELQVSLGGRPGELRIICAARGLQQAVAASPRARTRP